MASMSMWLFLLVCCAASTQVLDGKSYSTGMSPQSMFMQRTDISICSPENMEALEEIDVKDRNERQCDVVTSARSSESNSNLVRL